MFGRVRRAAATACPDAPIRAYGLLHTYNPATMASAIAAGMGAGAVGSGAGIVTLPDGRRVSAVAEAVSHVQNAGRKEQQRYVTLPGHVLVIATADDVRVWRWNTASTVGEQVANWPKRTYTVTSVDYAGQTGVRLVLDSGLIALLTGPEGHRRAEQILDAVMSLGRKPGTEASQ